MNKFFTTLLLLIVTCVSVWAQAPQKMTYQSVVRDVNNSLVANRNVSARIWILQGSAEGSAVYIETQLATTNANGLMTLALGEGTVVAGSLSAINWANGPYFLKTEMDPEGGSNYSLMTVQELLSVPYALYANEAANSFSGDYNDLTNTPEIPTVPTNVSTFTNDAGYLTPATVQNAVTIPTNVSAFTNDAGYITATQVPAQVNADWNATDGSAEILNKPTVPPAANDATLTLQQNGTLIGTFTSNASSDTTLNVTVPTVTDQLANDIGYLTLDSLPTNVSTFTNDAGYLTAAQCGDTSLCEMANMITSLQSQIGQLQTAIGQLAVELDSLDYARFICGTSTVKDFDNNVYNTVQLGNQCWMKENLRTTHYADGTEIPTSIYMSSSVAYRYYPNNDASLVPTYGYLYNWTAVMHGSASSSTNPSGVQGICPAGWHVPSRAEWTQLTDFVSSQVQYACNGNSLKIAKALASTTGWDASGASCAVGNNPSTNNATGFAVLPTGYYFNGSNFFGSKACFWSAEQNNDNNSSAWHYSLDNESGTVSDNSANIKSSAEGIRCVRDALGLSGTMPTVTTDVVSDITAVSATCGGEVTADGGIDVTARGICWGTSQNPTLADSHTTDSMGMGSFTIILTNLTPNTTYYVRAYATNSHGTSYGQQQTFTTPVLSLPSVTTASVSDITYTTAVCGGEVTAEGDAPVTERGVCWTTYGMPMVNDDHIAVGSGLGSFTATLTGLATGTHYFVRAYAISSVGTVYGDLTHFTTLHLTLPTVTTAPVSDITFTTAVCGGEVTADGGAPVTARGICWNTMGAPTLEDSHTVDGDGLGSFTSNITDLAPGTIYFVRAYATNSQGTRYGQQQYFTTPSMSLPIVILDSVSDITFTTAVCSGNVTSDGNAPVTARGVCWSHFDVPTLADSHTTDGEGMGSFTSSITGLTPGYFYYVRAYATNSQGTSYSNLLPITTPSMALPTVITNNAGDITFTSATLGGEVTSEGDAPVTERGICWATSGYPTVNGNHIAVGSGLGGFSTTVTGLDTATRYYVRAYAISSAGTVYGNLIAFSTNAAYMPSVMTAFASDITYTTVTVGGEVIEDGGVPVTERGVCWFANDSGFPTVNDDHIAVGSGLGSFTVTVTDLTPGTYYRMRAYATNSAGTSYGGLITFYTSTLRTPSVTIDSVSDITFSTIVCSSEVTDDGGTPVTARGVCWSHFGAPTLADRHTTDGDGLGSFTSIVTGLAPGYSYFVRAYATNSQGTRYSDLLNFTTPYMASPTVITNNASDITYTTATCSGEVTAEGDAPVTERGICWTISGYPTVDGDHIAVGSGLGSFTTTLTDLVSGINYYVRTYAISSAGTVYGGLVYFTTQAQSLPSVTTASVSDITQTTAVCGGEVTVDGGSPVTARGICWSTSVTPTLADNYTIDRDGLGSFTSSITGLTPGTTYYVRAYAINSLGTKYGQSESFTTTALSLPTVTTVSASDITYTSATLGGEVTSEGDAPVTERGICWTTHGYPMVTDNHIAVGSGLGSFTTSLTGLASGTNYFIRAYAISSAGTVYGDLIYFTTLTLSLPSVTTTPASNITHTTAVCGGEVTDDGGLEVTARGVCWGTTGAPNLQNNHTIDGAGLGGFTSSITGLTPGTTYYVRAYAINSLGTMYGSPQSFTTPALSLPTVTTDTVGDITYTTAVCGGEVTDEGDAPVTERGVCWTTSGTPTVNGNHIAVGSGLGSFSTTITGLDTATVYYVRAYAISSESTVYGDMVQFTTDDPDGKPCSNAPTVTDFDGNTYNTVFLGHQCWMKENLRTTHFADGTFIPLGSEVSNTMAYRYVPNNDPTTVPAYGYFYNWYAVMEDDLSSEANPSDVWGICPTGWHVPSIAEWLQLRDYMRSKSKYWCGGDSTNIATALASTTGWRFSNTDYCDVGNNNSSNNSSGFSAFPVGIYSSSNTSENFGRETYFWSSTQDTIDSNFTQTIGFENYNERERMRSWRQWTGLSVRCILNTDVETANLPTVTTDPVGNITYTTATCGGSVTDDGGLAVTARGICWGTTPNPTVNGLHTTEGSGTGSFTSSISGLSLGTTYYVRAYATNSLGTMYGQQVTFTTLALLPTVITKPVTSISTTAAVSVGEVTDDGEAAVTARGICWGTSPNPTVNGMHSTEGVDTGLFVSILTNLTPNTTYYVRAYATNSAGTAYGEQMSFTTLGAFVCGTSTISDIDNISYNTVQIGNQCWMKENLRVTHKPDGTLIPTSSASDYYYLYEEDYRSAPYDDENNVPTYGYLYAWKTIMNGAASSDANPSGVQGICPLGWHIPSKAEWTQLIDFATSQAKYVCHGDPDAIAYAFSVNYYWNYSSEWCTPCYWSSQSNISGFSAIPAGYAPHSAFNYGAFFWSSTQTTTSVSYAYDCRILYDQSQLTIGNQSTYFGNSVRCLRDDLGESMTLPTAIVDSIFNITPTLASSVSHVTSDGGDSVTDRGVCWSTSPNPTVHDNHTSDGEGLGSFMSDLTDMNAGSIYYVRAYATNSVGTGYGPQVSFTTVADSVYCVGISIPYSNNFRNSDDNVCWSIVDANGDGNTFRFYPYFGNVEYAEYPNVYTPTKADEYLISPTFTFTGNPTVVSYKNRNGHWENVIYEVLAFGPDTVLLVPPDTFHSNIWVRHRLNVSNLNGDYAIAFHCISDANMGYLEFTDFNVYEVSLPDVETHSCYELSDFSARVGGWLNSDGGADAEVGFCWSTSPNPTFNDNHFVSNNLKYMYFADTLTDLTPNTTYYVRAYATNFLGTSFGEQEEFTTTDLSLNGVPCPDAPTVTDVDNNVYNTVRLGNQCWMKENLRTTHYADNTPISLGGNNVSATTPYRYYPNNNSYTVSTYGYLYNMAAVRHGAASSNSIPSGVQGICPDGWHVPSCEEWYELRMFLINHRQVYACYGGSMWSFNNAKALASTTGWAVNYDPEGSSSCSPIVNPSTNNATNFTALPAGIRYGNNTLTFPYEEIGWYAQFWSCTQETSNNGAVMLIDGYYDDVIVSSVNKTEGCSVRCLRDQ